MYSHRAVDRTRSPPDLLVRKAGKEKIILSTFSSSVFGAVITTLRIDAR
jgi:hypothetical protein